MLKERPSRLIVVGNNFNGKGIHYPLSLGHTDDSALHVDFRAPTGSLKIDILGKTLTPVVSESQREAPFQSDTGGELEANVKLTVKNIFAYIMRSDDHYPPADLEAYAKTFGIHNRYLKSVMGRHRDTYINITTQNELVTAIKTPGKIGAIRSVEGMSEHVGKDIDATAKLFSDAGIQIINLMWNHPTDVGDTHKSSEDYGLTNTGKELLEATFGYGMRVFDVSHASPRTAEAMIRLGQKLGCKVIASHTGAQNEHGKERTRNITDKVAEGIFGQGGIVGVATTEAMVGGSTIDHVVAAIEHFVKLDPTHGKLVTLGPDTNGIAKGKEIDGAATVIELQNIAVALLRKGYDLDFVLDIFWRNAYDFWHSTFEDVKNPA
ncbi:MAG TPA: membrane dipeptidase [Candidatus Limnocylindrales bacterium]|nr:membrane dipeptidase [Candidatus Limnocylindrales bacterium]